MFRVPNFDSLVVGGGVDVACAAPADTSDGAFVAGQDGFNTFGNDVPDADC